MSLFGGQAASSTGGAGGGGLFSNPFSGAAGSGAATTAGSTATSSAGGGLFSNPFGAASGAANAPAATAAAAPGGLFGSAPAASSAPRSNSLFSGAPPASAPSGGLFGGTGTATSSAPSGGLFGGATAASTAPTSGGLLAPPAATTAAGTSGLFSSLGGGNQQQTQPNQSTGAGSLFGGAQQSQAPAAGSLFGAGQQSQQAPAGSSLFGGAQQAQAPAASSLLGSMNHSTAPQAQQPPGDLYHAAYFHSLLEKNKKRTREGEDQGGFAEMPGLQLNLGDIQKRVRELNGMSPRARPDRAADTKAHYLLAASGVNPGSTMRDLRSFAAQHGSAAVPAPAAPEWEPDTHKYVEQLQQQTTLKMIAEGIERAQRDFNTYLDEHVDINWEEQRRKVYEHFGLARRDPLKSTLGPDASRLQGSFGRSTLRRGRGVGGGDSSRPGTPSKSQAHGLQKSVLGTPAVGAPSNVLFGEPAEKATGGSSGVDDRMLREKEARYASKVQGLNEARLRDVAFPLLREFESVEAHEGTETPSQIIDAYKALVEIVREGSADIKLRARHYRSDYLEDNAIASSSVNLNKQILAGSRRALEKQFYDQLTTLVARNPKEASIGGVPSTLNRVRGYVRIRHARKDLAPDGMELQMINDDHCWALLFFLIRSGYVREAAKYVKDNKTAFQSIDRSFVTYMQDYIKTAEQRLAPSLQDKINSEYQQRLRIAPDKSLDPYRMAVYKIIGRCDLSKRSLEFIHQGVEDWIWLQFALAREGNRSEEFAGDVYNLHDIQHTIREIGQRHFHKGGDGTGGFGTFFMLQILGGMFEAAVAYLYQHAYVSAVHFAIALNFYGLLRVSSFDASETDILTYTTKEQPQINFGRMLGYYTRDFRAANAVAATDYLCLIHLDADAPAPLGRAQAQLCYEALRELVLETREFAALLGDIRSDGTHLRGAIEARLALIGLRDPDDFLRAITMQAASVADNAGRTTDAVLLYHLGADYDAVIAVVNRALSEAVAVELGSAPPKVAPVKARPTDGGTNGQAAAAAEPQAGSSFSLTAVDDPVTLARNFVALYETSAMFFGKISPQNRETCASLLRISQARDCVEAGEWAQALEVIASLSLLPLQARGAIPAIRAQAQNLAALSPPLSRLIGPLLLWAMTCIANQRALQLGAAPPAAADDAGAAAGVTGDNNHNHNVAYGGPRFESEARRALVQELVQQAKDLMVFAGLMRLRLGKGVWEGIVQGAGEMGVY